MAKSYEALKRLFARRPKPRLPLRLPTKKPDNISGNRRDTDTLTTGPTLATVAPPFERLSEQSAQPLTQAYHSYTHTLLGVVCEECTGLSGPPVGTQEKTVLLSCCGLIGTSQDVSLLGPGGKRVLCLRAQRMYILYPKRTFFPCHTGAGRGPSWCLWDLRPI